jgi:hypothetical protein
MRRKRTNLQILAAAILAAVALLATDVAAELRVSATVSTPAVSIRVGNAYVGYRPLGPIRPLPCRGPIHRTIRHDVQVAHRLAWYTGMPQGELLRYRRFGYSWYEIARWLYLPGRVVRAAMSERGWNLFLHEGGYHAGYYGRHGRGGHRHDRYGDHYCEIYEYGR